jgi:hypothetical protein
MPDRLSSVQDYITDVRVLLQDNIAPNRYTDAELLVGLNTALLEGRRLRADLFVYKHGNHVPNFNAVSGEEVPIEPQFRLGFVYGTCAHALRRDDEDVQDERANSFMNAFQSILVGVKIPPVTGGTPGPGTPTK